MTSPAHAPAAAGPRTSWRRRWVLFNLLMALFALIWVTVHNIFWGTPPPPDQEPGLFPERFSAAERLADQFSYFTVWSATLVALAMALILVRPGTRSRVIRVLHLTSLVMITITGLVYWTMLAATSTDLLSVGNLSLHLFTPVVTLLTWLVAGPAGWLELRLLPGILVVPALWLVFTFVRGAILGVYPYGFINLVRVELGEVVRFVAQVLGVAVVLGAAYCLIDRVLPGRARARAGRIIRAVTERTPVGRRTTE